MLHVRRSNERGHADHGWLNSYHTFSFADYHDPRFMGFRSLRVINEDWIAAGQGFGMHPHQNMEIITYVVKGALEHKDSLGSSEVIRPGEIQRMTAGSGIMHSEFNPSKTEATHLLQIWLFPDRRNLPPGYVQRPIPEGKDNELVLIASPDERDGSVKIHQDVRLYRAKLPREKTIAHAVESGRALWLQLISGKLVVGEQTLEAGDALAVEDEDRLSFTVSEDAELLLFDLV